MGKNYRIAEWRILTVSEFDQKKSYRSSFLQQTVTDFLYLGLFFTDYWSFCQILLITDLGGKILVIGGFWVGYPIETLIHVSQCAKHH